MVTKFFPAGKKLFAREQTNILSAAAVITVASFLTSVFGFIKTRLLLSRFSATLELRQTLDAYWVALRLPELIFQLLVVGALSAAFIPIFSKYLQKDRSEAYHISSAVMTMVLLIFLTLSLVIFIFALPFTEAITSVQFTPSQIHLAANLSRIMVVAQLFFAVSSFLTGTLQAQQRFLLPAISPLAYNFGIILGILFLTPFLGIYAAAIGVAFGAFLHLLLQIPLAIKLGFSYRPTFDLRHPGVKDMFRLMPPRALAISVTQVELSAMVFFTTALSSFSLTILQIAQQLLTAPIRILAVPIGQASLPFLAKETATGALTDFKRTFLNSFHQILYLAFPAGMFLLVLRIPLVRIVYGSRQVPWATTLLMGKTVAFLSLSLFAQSINHILTRAFYALHNTRTPFVIALFSALINITLAFLVVFKWRFGVVGLAASLSLAAIIQTGLLLVTLHRQVHGFTAQELLLPPVKMILASLVMAVFLWVPMRLLDQFVFDTTRTLNLILLTVIASLIGTTVYIGSSLLLRIEALSAFLSLARRIGNWQQVLKETEEVLEPASSVQEVKPV